jgi:hypothetical protein
VLPTNLLQTIKVNVIAKVSAWVATNVHFVPHFLKFGNYFLKVDFGVDGLIKFHVMADWLPSAAITIVVGNAEVFVVVPARLQQIDFVVANSHVEVQSVTFLCTAPLRKLIDV